MLPANAWVSSTTFSTVASRSSDGCGDVALGLFRGGIRKAAADAGEDLEASFALGDESLDHLDRDDSNHGLAGAFDDDDLPSVVNAIYQVRKVAPRLSHAYALDHRATPLFPIPPQIYYTDAIVAIAYIETDDARAGGGMLLCQRFQRDQRFENVRWRGHQRFGSGCGVAARTVVRREQGKGGPAGAWAKGWMLDRLDEPDASG